MSAIRRVATWGLALILAAGVGAGPVAADQAARSTDPQATSLLRASEPTRRTLVVGVRAAREQYAMALSAARVQRTQGLSQPRKARAAALDLATTKAQRKKATRAYRSAAGPIEAQYALDRKVARTLRDAELEVVLAAYLVKVGRPELTAALKVYRNATIGGRDSLALALRSTTKTLRTDTADERTVLTGDLEQANTVAERSRAWADFVSATAPERAAHASAVSGARAAYHSAMRQARADFKTEAGVGVRRLMRTAFGD